MIIGRSLLSKANDALPPSRCDCPKPLRLSQTSLYVRLNMSEPNNGQALSPKDNRLLAPKGSQARYTGEILLRTRPKTYRAIVENSPSQTLVLMASPDATA